MLKFLWQNILTISGNPIRNIRSDILNGGSKRIIRCLMDKHKEKQSEQYGGTSPENTVFPDKFKMSKTQTLNVANMNLQDLSYELIEIALEAGIHTIDLSRNRFTTFPHNLQNLSGQLDQINFSQNNLDCIPIVVGLFDKLVFLNLSMNCLNALPDEFGRLQNLRELDLSHNK